MELKQLKCFLTVAKLKNFTRAAEFLYTSQSTLSYQIGKLEEEIGGPLFTRGNAITLTPLGESMLPAVKKILADVDSLSDIYQHPDELTTQTLLMGISDLGHECMFNDCLEKMAAFFQENPQLKLETKILGNDECKEGLLTGELDAALITRVHMETLASSLDSMTVLLDRHVLVYHESFSQSSMSALLKKLPLAMHTGNLKGNRRIFSALGLDENYSNYILADNLAELTLLALSQRAVAVFPRSYYEFIKMPALCCMDIDRESICLKREIAWNRQRNIPAVSCLVQSMAAALTSHKA